MRCRNDSWVQKKGGKVWKWIPKALWRHQLSIWANLGTFLKLPAISNRFMIIIIRWYSKVPNISKNQLRPTCDVAWSIYAQNTPQISQMLITSLLNGIKSWNLAFRLILGCRIRLYSRKFQIFKIEAHMWRRVVHLGPNYSQNLSNVNNFSIKWNKKLKLGIVIFKNLDANGKQKKTKQNNILLL